MCRRGRRAVGSSDQAKMSEGVKIKPVRWLIDSRDELRKLPAAVQREIGFALYTAQRGGKHLTAKPLKGFGGAGVLEAVTNYDGDTYRAIYTVKFAAAVYVLHVFQKKSKSGIETPKTVLDLIKRRLKLAETDYQQRKQ